MALFDTNLHVDMGWHCTKAIPRSIQLSISIYFEVKSIWIKFGMEAAYIKVLGMATKAISIRVANVVADHNDLLTQ